MNGDNHLQPAERMHDFAEKIRREISESGSCNLHHSELAFIWMHDGALSDADKRMKVTEFACRYKFLSVIDYGLTCAVFRNSSQGDFPALGAQPQQAAR